MQGIVPDGISDMIEDARNSEKAKQKRREFHMKHANRKKLRKQKKTERQNKKNNRRK